MVLESVEFSVVGRLVKTAALRDSWIKDVDDPKSTVRELRARKIGADLFTFWQRFPDTEPRFNYHLEWDNWAVLPLSTYEEWFKNQINRKARTAVRKALKMGVEVRISQLDEAFISGVTGIFNETPIRQGKEFAHFGKSFEETKDELEREAARTDFIGAYYQGQMIGFVQQVYAKDCAHPFGGLTLLAHRDKSPNSALLAKAVEIAASRGMGYVVYGIFDYGTGQDGLAEFKIHNGFQKVLVPRYYVPLTLRGRIVLGLGLHHGLKKLVPSKLLRVVADLRKKGFSKRASG